MQHHVEPLFQGSKIQEELVKLSSKLNSVYKESTEPVILVAVLKGSFIFLADLCRLLTFPVQIDFLGASSYGNSTESSGALKITKDLAFDIQNKNVLLVEDIVDTGVTLTKVCAMLRERGLKDLKVVTLLDKPSKRKVDFQPDYSCFAIEDFFIVGYGIDYAENYRELPYIGILQANTGEK